MRLSIILGIVLIVAGAVVFFLGGTITSDRHVLELGGVSVSAEQRTPIQPWIAGAVFLAGVVLIGAGVRRKA